MCALYALKLRYLKHNKAIVTHPKRRAKQLEAELLEKYGCHERTCLQHALRARRNLISATPFDFNFISVYAINCLNCPQIRPSTTTHSLRLRA